MARGGLCGCELARKAARPSPLPNGLDEGRAIVGSAQICRAPLPAAANSWETHMRLMTIGVTMLIVGASAVAPIPPARAQGSCEQLWVERNTIFKARGYCFKTPRAISYFGNAGCLYDDEAALPL